uniref:DUF7745 domain-containing protein n=1 Tax=Nicotiana tabacum TaxID=4097 RepID=A0A1S4CYU7_TOBAC|nr:PREDICTED: uncharacterized protein LOC107824121 [Nicotiana tabacum]
MNTVQESSQSIIERSRLQLRRWWDDLDEDGRGWVKEQLGSLIDIMYIKPREDLIEALVAFWDPVHNVFYFSDFELNSTLEEISGYIDFGQELRKQQLIFPRAPSVHKFFDLLNISKQMNKAYVSKGCCSFCFLYYRFGHSAGFETHEKGLNNRQDKSIWQIHHRFTFIVAFLGVMIFLNAEGTIDVRMARIAQVLIDKKDHTLVPLVLADIYWALTLCKSGAQFFEGCQVLHQMWMIEHLCCHPKFMRYASDRNNFIKKYEERVEDYKPPEGFEAWVSYLRKLRANQIEWTIGWLPETKVIYMTASKGYFMMMGVRSIQPYAPQSVLR